VRHEELKEAFLQGEEREAEDLFREMMKATVRLGGMIDGIVDSL
jgi:hypothetical protein